MLSFVIYDSERKMFGSLAVGPINQAIEKDQPGLQEIYFNTFVFMFSDIL